MTIAGRPSYYDKSRELEVSTQALKNPNILRSINDRLIETGILPIAGYYIPLKQLHQIFIAKLVASLLFTIDDVENLLIRVVPLHVFLYLCICFSKSLPLFLLLVQYQFEFSFHQYSDMLCTEPLLQSPWELFQQVFYLIKWNVPHRIGDRGSSILFHVLNNCLDSHFNNTEEYCCVNSVQYA